MSLRTEVAKNNVIFTGGNIAAALLGFVFSVVAARLLGPEQFGLFSFALVVMGFFTIFIDLGISSTFIKFMSGCIESGENSKVRSLVGIFLRFRVLLTLLVALVMIIFSEQIAAMVFSKPGQGLYITLAAGILAANSVVEFINMMLLAFKSFPCIVGLRLLERVLRIAFVVSFVALGFMAAGAAAGVIASFIAVGSVGCLFVMRRYRNVLGARGEGFPKRTLMGFGFWVFIGALVSSIYAMTDALLIGALRPVQDVGFYSIALSWVTLITYVVPVSSVVMYPYFSMLGSRKNFEAFQGAIRYAFMTAMPLAFLMSAFSSPIISIFYEEPFMPAAAALSVLSFVSVALVVSPLFMGYLYGIGRPRVYAAIAAALFLLNLLLNYFMISAFGIWGAATATLISRVVELSVFMALVAISARILFRWDSVIKPVLASLAIYVLALWMPAQGIIQIVLYGVALLFVYAVIMFVIGGLEKEELKTILGLVRSAVRR